MTDRLPMVVRARRHDATFGQYLRHLRENAGLGLRDVAGLVGAPFTKLQRMEKGAQFRATDPALLDALADLFGVERSAFWQRAGFMEVDLRNPVVGEGGAPPRQPPHEKGYQRGWDAAVLAILASARALNAASPTGSTSPRRGSEPTLPPSAPTGAPLSPYQRGRRDALAELADALEARAADDDAEAERLRTSRHGLAPQLASAAANRAAAFRTSARVATLAAVDLPLEPRAADGGDD